MKPSPLGRAMMASLLTLGFITNIIYCNKMKNEENLVYSKQVYTPATIEVVGEEPDEVIEEPERIEVYDGLTIEELTDKINNILSSDLTGMGNYFAEYSVELGVDPYLAVAIAMHETGCTWDCSYLMKSCNNVGGQKGYGCGEYQAYDTLSDGIYGFVSNIKKNYVDYGLLTAEQMNPKYAEDPEWSYKVNKYIEKIKNS